MFFGNLAKILSSLFNPSMAVTSCLKTILASTTILPLVLIVTGGLFTGPISEQNEKLWTMVLIFCIVLEL